MQLVRRALFEGDTLSVGHVVARPSSPDCGDVEEQSVNVAVFPLAGLFAKHDGPRLSTIVTPNHAILVAAETPYRISYPGAIGDRCLTLRFTNAQADRMRAGIPHNGSPAPAPRALLSSREMLARNLLC